MENHEPVQEEEERNPKKKNELWEWLKALAIAIILAFVIRSFLFAPFVVDGTSMMPNLHDRERLIVTKLIYFFEQPTREEIIVFHATEDRDYIKRVIGVGGDKVEVRDDQLYINDKPVEEPYLAQYKEKAHAEGVPLTADFGPINVPKGELFVMGDNRRNSKDSRAIGTISLDRVVGRADVVFWPLDEFRFPNKTVK
ncbi:signal peptidase I [Ammoniphilus resinae]|uniref:Signal peptidase I n=1 Tax=Ammoniphilus resinae TaxID=861532 RepID=A0ABS4GKI6_9BACL|nr:signal peptidase I [Ammoniphilus resinae]MBP1930766.1 signal peptidase I [Ammoniphilus resinae]